jgi:hypothetical protein
MDAHSTGGQKKPEYVSSIDASTGLRWLASNSLLKLAFP